MRDGGPSRITVRHLARLQVADEKAARLGIAGGRLRLRRSWPTSPSHLLLEFVSNDGGLVPGQWMDDVLEMRRVADETTRRCPDVGPVLHRTGRGCVLLQAGGADRRLRGLRALVAREDSTLIVHRPERRAVVRLSESAGVRYAKVVRRSRLAGLVENARTVSRLACRAFNVPDILDVDERRGVVTWSLLGGMSLFELLEGDEAEALVAAREAGAALSRMHDATPPAGRVHDATAERHGLRRWLDLVQAHDPASFHLVRHVAHEVGDRLVDDWERRSFIHRDLHDKQLFHGPDGAGILDLDTCAGGDPALDVANLLAHFELRSLQARCSPSRAGRMSAAFLAGYDPASSLETRVGAYLDASRVRLACVYSFRPEWRHLTPVLVGRVGLSWQHRLEVGGKTDHAA